MYFDGYRQFIPWIIKTDAAGGKPKKIPLGSVSDPATWTTYEHACAVGNPGFVFTKEDPFFFLDIDHCFTPETRWSALAVDLNRRFSGCAVEISYSGGGLHIFGTGTPTLSTHRNRNSELGLELYTWGRFAALTGTQAVGSAFHKAQEPLDWLVNEYFKPVQRVAAAFGGESVLTDEEVLRIAARAKSVRAAFGGAATFTELYGADEDALRKHFPSTGERGFDWSAADAALLSHLAFYTGRDSEQMERVFSGSGLAKRSKWEARPDYRERSLNFAIDGCAKTYEPRAAPVSVEISGTGGGVSSGRLRAGLQFLNIDAQLEYFKGCAYVVDKHEVFVPGRGALKPDRFKAVFGGYQFAKASEGKPTTNAFEAFTESQLYDFPVVDDICFRPEEPPASIIPEEGRTLVNTYEKIPIESRAGGASPFTGLLERLLPNARDRTILLSYMAACVQYPGKKFQWAPVVQGVEGNGKTLLATAMTNAIGHRYSHMPSANDLSGNGLKFTGWMYGKLFIAIEDLFPSDRMDIQEALKPKITNDRTEFQFKGGGQFVGDNRANFMMFCNHKDALRITEDGRRYCPLYTDQQSLADLARCGMSGAYFPKLYEWARGGGWAIITHYLQSYAIPDEFNPAGLCQRAPETSSSQEARRESLGPIEQEILEAVAEGRLGFRGGWISSVALDILLIDKKFKLAHNKRRELLRGIGYIVKERLNAPSATDGGKRPVLYVRPESAQAHEVVGATTAAAYAVAQASIQG